MRIADYNQMMENFHVIDSAARGYQFVWDHRTDLIRLAILPFMVKIGCLSLMILMGYEENFLRQGLVFLPAHFAEGWFATHLIMMLMHSLMGQRSLLSDQHGSMRLTYRQRLQASIALYVIIQLVIALLLYAGNTYAPAINATKTSPPSLPMFFLSISIVGFLIWTVRLSWAYVPLAMGYGLIRYLRTFKPYIISFYMIGLMLLCTVPSAVLMIILISLMDQLFNIAQMPAPLTSISVGILQSFVQLVVVALGTAGMTYAIYPALSGQDIKS